jgi:hypothetical protein
MDCALVAEDAELALPGIYQLPEVAVLPENMAVSLSSSRALRLKLSSLNRRLKCEYT